MILTLEEMQTHLRLPLDPDSEIDPQLEDIEAAAVDYASMYLNRDIPWDSNGVPASIKQALLLLVGDMSENREDNAIGTIVGRIDAVERLLHFYRVEIGI